MIVSHKHFNITVIVLAALAVFLFPVWPWCHWGFLPSFLVVGIVLFLFGFMHLARD